MSLDAYGGFNRPALIAVIQAKEDALSKAIAERDSWKAEAKKWEALHESLADPLMFEQERDSYGPTEDLPETVKRIVAERDAALERVQEVLLGNQHTNDEQRRAERERDAAEVLLLRIIQGDLHGNWLSDDGRTFSQGAVESLLRSRKLIPEGK